VSAAGLTGRHQEEARTASKEGGPCPTRLSGTPPRLFDGHAALGASSQAVAARKPPGHDRFLINSPDGRLLCPSYRLCLTCLCRQFLVLYDCFTRSPWKCRARRHPKMRFAACPLFTMPGLSPIAVGRPTQTGVPEAVGRRSPHPTGFAKPILRALRAFAAQRSFGLDMVFIVLVQLLTRQLRLGA